MNSAYICVYMCVHVYVCVSEYVCATLIEQEAKRDAPSKLTSAGETHAIITVFELPPNESWRRRVILLSRKGTCWPCKPIESRSYQHTHDVNDERPFCLFLFSSLFTLTLRASALAPFDSISSNRSRRRMTDDDLPVVSRHPAQK